MRYPSLGNNHMPKQSNPKVTISIPAYNYAHYLPDAIESVLNQSFSDFELLVIDNCSTDNTREVVEAYIAHDKRVRYICNESNIGLVGNLNRSLSHARGEYVKILCADDLLESTCLEKMVLILDSNPNVSLVASRRMLVNGELKPITSVGYSHREGIFRGVDVINRCLINGNLIGEPSAVLFRRNQSSRGFNIEYMQMIDVEMWFYLLSQGDFAYIPENLCFLRQHEGQGTKDSLKTFAYLPEENRLFDAFIREPFVDSSFLNRLNWKFRMTMNIWQQRHICNDPEAVRVNMDKYINHRLFYLIYLPVMGMKKFVKILRRISDA